MPSQLSKGTAAFNNYPGTNSQVTADLLNNLVDNGTILPGAISEQSSVAAATSDEVLIRRPGTNLLHKTTVDSIISNVVFPVPPTPTNIPIGGVIMWGVAVVPTGWLECNGGAISSTLYPTLFALWGATLPDLRGEFVRGWSNNRTDVDYPRGIRSWEEDEIPAHTHSVPEGGFQITTGAGSYYTSASGTAANQRLGQTTGATGGTGMNFECRPRNVAFMYIVRAL